MTHLLPALGMVLAGTGFTFFMTAAGSAVVFFFRGEIKPIYQRVFLGFAAGVMIAASVWSLIVPAVEMAESQGMAGWIPAAGGFALGGLFLMLLDKLLPHLHSDSDTPEGLPSSLKRTTMLVFAVTLHNIPEGMAVGLSFALAAGGHDSTVSLAAAMALALGMGLQNFPEGAAISLPLKKEGLPNWKAFVYGALSGIVEPIGGVLTVLLDRVHHLDYALAAHIRRRRHDLRGCGGADSRSASQSRRPFPRRDHRRHGWLFNHDGTGYCPGIENRKGL